MAGRNDNAMAAAMEAMARAVQGAPNVSVNEEFRKNQPPVFKGRFDPDGAQLWLKEIERIFRVMDCAEENKVRLGCHMLREEADDWWVGMRQILEVDNEEVTWELFRTEFLLKYYPESVKGKKEMEFLELKQGSMSVVDYTAKFVELVQFHSHYAAITAEFSKCIKYENGLRPEIKQAVGYQRIRRFADLTECCRIFEEDSKARSTHYKSVNERRGKQQARSGPYVTPVDKGKHKGNFDRRYGGGGSGFIKCFKCGEMGHKSNECKKAVMKCSNCGGMGHSSAECRRNMVKCYNCGEVGHISTKCTKPK